MPSSSHVLPTTPNPYLVPISRHPTHTRTISAPVHLTSPPPYSAKPPSASPSRPRPELRVITSFPPPPPRRTVARPSAGAQSLKAAAVLRQPVPIRHPALEPLRTAPLPLRHADPPVARSSSHRKPVPDLHVHVDLDEHLLSRPSRPEPVRTSSLDKRRNRGAVIISTGMYTSYQPSADWGLGEVADEPGTGESLREIIPPSSRPSGRGHKRTISDKFKSLFSPPPSRAPLQIVPSPPIPHVTETFERVPIYDDGDIPTYSATYPQPDDPFHLAVPLSSAMGTGQPGRPYRSPGTASFVVNREEVMWSTGEEEGMDENAVRRNTFGIPLEDGDVCMELDKVEMEDDQSLQSVVGLGIERSSSAGGSEADDEMSASSDQEVEIVDAYFGPVRGRGQAMACA